MLKLSQMYRFAALFNVSLQDIVQTRRRTALRFEMSHDKQIEQCLLPQTVNQSEDSSSVNESEFNGIASRDNVLHNVTA